MRIRHGLASATALSLVSFGAFAQTRISQLPPAASVNLSTVVPCETGSGATAACSIASILAGVPALDNAGGLNIAIGTTTPNPGTFTSLTVDGKLTFGTSGLLDVANTPVTVNGATVTLGNYLAQIATNASASSAASLSAAQAASAAVGTETDRAESAETNLGSGVSAAESAATTAAAGVVVAQQAATSAASNVAAAQAAASTAGTEAGNAQSAVTAETGRAEGVEAGLAPHSALDAETTRAEGAEIAAANTAAGAASAASNAASAAGNAQTAVGTETSRAEQAEAGLVPTTALTAETNRAEQAETAAATTANAASSTATLAQGTASGAQTAAAAETTRAKSVEATLAPETSLAAEITRAEAAEAATLSAASPALTGVPTVPTAPALTNDGQIASTGYTDAAVAVETSRALAAEAVIATNAALSTETSRAEAAEATKAPLASPGFTGIPTGPTAPALTNGSQLASTGYTDAAVGVESTRAKAAESAVGTTASSALSLAQAAAPASALASETSRAEAAEAGFAPSASPSLTGRPLVPTAPALTNSSQIASTGYADAAVAVEKARATAAEGSIATNGALSAETNRAEGAEALLAPLASAPLTGTPTAPTASPLTGGTQLATAGYADAAVAVEKSRATTAESSAASAASAAQTTANAAAPASALTSETSRAETAEGKLAPLASAPLTGTPTVPTASPLTNSTQIASTGYADAAVGVERSRATAAEGSLASGVTAAQNTANAAAPSSSVTTETNRAEGAEALLAPLASAPLTGKPTAPTASPLTGGTQLATAGYTDAAVGVETSRAQAAENAAASAASSAQTTANAAAPASSLTAETNRAKSAEALLAPLASAPLTGTPTAPTASPLTGGTQLATAGYADAAVAVEKSRATTAESNLASSSGLSAETSRAEAAEAAKAPLASPGLTGTPTAPTANPLTNNTQVSSTGYTDAAVAVEKSRASAAESSASTAASNAQTTANAAATSTALGNETSRAQAAEAAKAPLASAPLTGTPTAPTASPLTGGTQLATAGYADAAVAVEKSRATTAESNLASNSALSSETSRAETAEGNLAPLASPALTGKPTVPTASALTNTTQAASTGYTDAAVAVEKTRATGVEAAKADLVGGQVPSSELPSGTSGSSAGPATSSVIGSVKPDNATTFLGGTASSPTLIAAALAGGQNYVSESGGASYISTPSSTANDMDSTHVLILQVGATFSSFGNGCDWAGKWVTGNNTSSNSEWDLYLGSNGSLGLGDFPTGDGSSNYQGSGGSLALNTPELIDIIFNDSTSATTVNGISIPSGDAAVEASTNGGSTWALVGSPQGGFGTNGMNSIAGASTPLHVGCEPSSSTVAANITSITQIDGNGIVQAQPAIATTNTATSGNGTIPDPIAAWTETSAPDQINGIENLRPLASSTIAGMVLPDPAGSTSVDSLGHMIATDLLTANPSFGSVKRTLVSKLGDQVDVADFCDTAKCGIPGATVGTDFGSTLAAMAVTYSFLTAAPGDGGVIQTMTSSADQKFSTWGLMGSSAAGAMTASVQDAQLMVAGETLYNVTKNATIGDINSISGTTVTLVAASGTASSNNDSVIAARETAATASAAAATGSEVITVADGRSGAVGDYLYDGNNLLGTVQALSGTNNVSVTVGSVATAVANGDTLYFARPTVLAFVGTYSGYGNQNLTEHLAAWQDPGKQYLYPQVGDLITDNNTTPCLPANDTIAAIDSGIADQNYGTITLTSGSTYDCPGGTAFTFRPSDAMAQLFSPDWLAIQQATLVAQNGTGAGGAFRTVWLPDMTLYSNRQIMHAKEDGKPRDRLMMRGEGTGSAIKCETDLGYSKVCVGADVDNGGQDDALYQDFTIEGPGYGSNLTAGVAPAAMDGLFLAEGSNGDNLDIEGFNNGVDINVDHQHLTNTTLTGNLCGVAFSPLSESTGNQVFAFDKATSNTLASICVYSSGQMDSSTVYDMHVGFSPYGVLKLKPNATEIYSGSMGSIIDHSLLENLWQEATAQGYIVDLTKGATFDYNQLVGNDGTGGDLHYGYSLTSTNASAEVQVGGFIGNRVSGGNILSDNQAVNGAEIESFGACYGNVFQGVETGLAAASYRGVPFMVCGGNGANDINNSFQGQWNGYFRETDANLAKGQALGMDGSSLLSAYGTNQSFQGAAGTACNQTATLTDAVTGVQTTLNVECPAVAHGTNVPVLYYDGSGQTGSITTLGQPITPIVGDSFWADTAGISGDIGGVVSGGGNGQTGLANLR